jgi:formylmethanofuran dehydrogenase subunit B
LDKGPPDADLTVSLGPEEETAALSLMRASLASAEPEGEFSPGLRQALALVPRLTGARYAVIVHDAEPSAQERNPRRVEGLIAFTQALNGPTRAALSSLRAGGNQVGADSVLTWQTGYPFAVDYTRGYPRYAPGERGLHRLLAGGLSAVLLVGAPALREDASAALARIKSVVIGPRATESTYNPRVAIDTGVAGIHEGGTAYRMDEVPLPLHPPLAAKRTTTETLAALIGSVRARRGGKRP